MRKVDGTRTKPYQTDFHPKALNYSKLFCQDIFVKKVLRSKVTVNRTEGRKKRGWYTVERMRTKLLWSKCHG